jgi:DNA-binding transcriptional regulator/RsmH inhibitor MraZ
VLIPPQLREFAHLESDAHIIGVITNLEIWNPDAWNTEKENTKLESIASTARALGL